MCIVIAGISPVTPTRNELTISCLANPDGFGYAIAVDKGSGLMDLSVNRGMDATVIIDGFLDEISAYGDSVVCWSFHARISTHGLVSLENCHPFFIGDDTLSALSHNGILPVSIARGDTRSDSRVFAEDYLPEVDGVRGLGRSAVADLLEGFVEGSNSKVVIISANPDADYPLTILGESLGHWRNKVIWFSNHGYEPFPVSTYAQNYRIHTQAYDKFDSGKEGDFAHDIAAAEKRFLTRAEVDSSEKYSRCSDINCGSFVSEFDDYCPTCGACQMCEQHASNCVCYTVPFVSMRSSPRGSPEELL